MMLAVGFSTAAPLCFFSGGLFALAWELYRSGAKSGGTSISVYLAESLGSGAGGLFFYFILLPRYPSFAGSLILVLFLLTLAVAVGAVGKYSGRVFCLLFSLGILVGVSILFGYSDRVDLLTHRAQWGKSFFQAKDTPYHNLVFVFDSGQFSLFSNGLWLFSSKDPQTAEPAAHLPLLEHPHPEKVLAIGDYSPEMLGEVLKHPGITAVDCVQPDAELTEFTGAVLPPSHTQVMSDRRVRVFHTDPRRLKGGAGIGYDVILLSSGEPVNAEMNRFYTVEFFSRIKSLMNPGGLFSFGVPAAPDIIGPREAVLLKSLHQTLRQVFGHVVIVPGETARFIASQAGTGMTGDPQVLIGRMSARSLDLKYVRDFYLLDLFNPMRLAYMESIVREGPQAKINMDFEPVCYLYGLGLWGAQLHPAAGRIFGFLSQSARFWVLTGIAAVFLVLVLLLPTKGSPGLVVAFNTGVCGAVLIVVEVMLVLVYQIMEGSVYKQMALMISLFMAGLAAGSALARFLRGRGLRRLFIVQTGLAAYLGLLYLLFSVFRTTVLDRLGHDSMLLLFSGLAFLAGMLGGGQFFAAVSAIEKRMQGTGSQGEQPGNGPAGASLYAADLIGASAGALAGSLFFIPVFGIPKTLLIIGLGCVAATSGIGYRMSGIVRKT
jgi:spermidine synthase